MRNPLIWFLKPLAKVLMGLAQGLVKLPACQKVYTAYTLVKIEFFMTLEQPPTGANPLRRGVK